MGLLLTYPEVYYFELASLNEHIFYAHVLNVETKVTTPLGISAKSEMYCIEPTDGLHVSKEYINLIA